MQHPFRVQNLFCPGLSIYILSTQFSLAWIVAMVCLRPRREMARYVFLIGDEDVMPAVIKPREKTTNLPYPIYSAMSIYRGHFFSKITHDRHPWLAREFEVWPKFYLRNCFAEYNNVLYCTSIYRDSIVLLYFCVSGHLFSWLIYFKLQSLVYNSKSHDIWNRRFRKCKIQVTTLSKCIENVVTTQTPLICICTPIYWTPLPYPEPFGKSREGIYIFDTNL